MRIITEKHLKLFSDRHPDSASAIEMFIKVFRNATWKNLEEVRKVFPHADAVKVKSGNVVTVFNLGGNKYRVMTAIHFNRGNVYILTVLPHVEYTKDQWKEWF